MACSGGGGSSSTASSGPVVGAVGVTGLTMASKVSAASAGTGGSLKPDVIGLKIMDTKANLNGWASTVDYYKDTTSVYTRERTDEALQTPNMILCMMKQAAYDTMVNRGDKNGYYIAQVDQNLCSTSQDSASNAGSSNQSSGSAAPNYWFWTVQSTRADSNPGTPQYVRIWFQMDKGGGGSNQKTHALMLVEILITSGYTTTNPYGLFNMNFAAYPADATGVITSQTPVMKGILRAVNDPNNAGKVLLEYWMAETGGGQTNTQGATVSRSSDGATGGGEVTYTDYTWDNTSGQSTASPKRARFAFSTGSGAFIRQGLDTTLPYSSSGAAICEDTANFKYSVWSYGMYDVNGARVNLMSGFPIKYTDSRDHYGYVGNWGMNFMDDVTVADGATVYKQVWSNGAPSSTPYTLKKSGGKLTKYTQSGSSLNQLDGVGLSYGTSSGGSFSNYNLHWSTASGAFVLDSLWNQSTNQMTPLTGALDVSALKWNNNLQMFSQSLGGQVIIMLPASGGYFTSSTASGTLVPGTGTTFGAGTGSGCLLTPAGSGNNWTNTWNCSYAVLDPAKIGVIFYSRQNIFSGDSAISGTGITLTCYTNCPDATAVAANAGVAFLPAYDGTGNPVPYTYTFNKSAYTLKDGTGTSLVMTSSGSGLSAGNYGGGGTFSWGLQTGALFDPTATLTTATGQTITYLQALACPWNSAMTCAWNASSILPVYYIWETGSNPWNTLTTLLDSSNTPLKFDGQADVAYTYGNGAGASGNSLATDNKYSGKTFHLQYGGFGQLWGIPGVCVNADTGATDITCNMNDRYVPEWIIPAGSSAKYSYTSSGGTLISGTGYIKALDEEKQMLSKTCPAYSLTAYTILTSDDWVVPANSQTLPTVINPAPAVIAGTVQLAAGTAAH
ncbi:MAG: hypothetical protein HY280_00645 [Nitrospinae bacterium]|nr:hypothetical protein [Nitrospinota bacterium]